VKELRLEGISDREAGNAFLERFRGRYNRKFAGAPRSDRDAHRPLTGSEDFQRLFSLHELRRLTLNLTLHYKRVMYVVEPTPAAERARGKRVSVREEENGTVHLEFKGEPLVARASPKDARVRQGAIVENKLLGDTLRLIQEAQRQRDNDRLQNTRMTLHEEDALRRAMGEPGLPTRRKDAPPRSSRSLDGRAPVVLAGKSLLGDVLEWAKQQASAAPVDTQRQSTLSDAARSTRRRRSQSTQLRKPLQAST